MRFLTTDKDADRIAVAAQTMRGGEPPEVCAGVRAVARDRPGAHRYREPKDRTIHEKFDTYRFADHNAAVIELLMRVTAVSVETVRIVAAMKGAGR